MTKHKNMNLYILEKQRKGRNREIQEEAVEAG